MARDILQTVALTNDDDGVCASQSPGAGAILINGALATSGVATVASGNMGQIITLTSGGNDSGITFTVTGKDSDGRTISDVITGGNVGAVVSTRYFNTVTGIVQSGAVAGTLIVGPLQANGGVTRTLPANFRAPNFGLGLGLTVSGTITCTVQHTFADLRDATWVRTWFTHSSLAAKTANADGNYAFGITGIRLLVVPTSSATAYLEVVGS